MPPMPPLWAVIAGAIALAVGVLRLLGFKWHAGFTIGRRKSFRLAPVTRLVVGGTRHYGRRQHRRRR